MKVAKDLIKFSNHNQMLTVLAILEQNGIDATCLEIAQ
jgi:hypothetical protein